MKKADIYEFFRRLEERDPEPKGELYYTNPYTLVVSPVDEDCFNARENKPHRLVPLEGELCKA